MSDTSSKKDKRSENIMDNFYILEGIAPCASLEEKQEAQMTYVESVYSGYIEDQEN